MGQDSLQTYRCSFCSKTNTQVIRILRAAHASICNECIELCIGIMKEENGDKVKKASEGLPTPQEMYDFLDEYVIGQSAAKKALSVAVYNHYKRTLPFTAGVIALDEEVEISKSNILLMGSTGTGKTYLAKTLARMMEVPFVIVDATALTEAGYIGEDVENILLRLIQQADGDIEKAEHGIIYIDEVDKIARRADSASMTRDVSGEGVQQALLKIIEGTTASVPEHGGRKHPHQEFIQIDTSNILFIVAGSFAGLESVISERINKSGVGFGASLKSDVSSQIFTKVRPEDLTKFGLIPEFIGRLPVITSVDPLSKDDLVHILTEPKNAIIKEYKKSFEIDGVVLNFDQDALEAVAQLAIERETGARGLRSIIENILQPVMFEIPSRDDIESIQVTRDSVLNDAHPVYTFRTTRATTGRLRVASIRKAVNG